MKIKIPFLFLLIFLSINVFSQTLNVSITSSQNVTCNGMCNGSAVATATGGTGNYTYAWSNGSVSGNTSNLCAGTFSVVVSDGLTQDTAYTVISQPPPIAINISTPAAICPGGTVSICPNVTGGTGPYTYNWAPVNGLSTPTVACPIFGGSTSTNYTLTVVDANGCVASATVSAVVNNINAAATNTGPYCSGGAIQLFATGGISYLWTGPNGFTSNLSNPNIFNATTAMSGIYTVTVTAPSGCTTTATTSVTVNNPPTASPYFNGPICSGNNLILYPNSQGAVTFNWTGPNGYNSTSQNASIYNVQPVNSGTYTLTLTSSTGCTNTATVSVIVTAAPAPNIISITEPSCSLNNGSITLSATNGTPPYLYSGTFCGAGSFGPSSISLVSNVCAGQANINITDANGCTGTLNVSIADSCDLTWPGDANDDLVVDNLDALEIGLGNGINGNARLSAGNNWNGHTSYPWGTVANGVSDDKHIDCDGNGIIDLSDTNAVVLNYGLTRPSSRIGKFDEEKISGGNAVLKVDIIQDTIAAGGIGNIALYLGDAINPITNFYGIAFTLNFDANIIDPTKFSMNAIGSWAGTQNTNLFSILLNDGVNGTVKGTLSRFDHNNINGQGLLANLGFQTKTSYSGTQTVNISVSDIKLINNVNQTTSVIAVNDSAIALNPILSNNETTNHAAHFFPNPFTSFLNLKMEKTGNYLLKICDPSGKTIKTISFTGSKLLLESSDISNGIYFYEISSSNTVISRGKIIKD